MVLDPHKLAARSAVDDIDPTETMEWMESMDSVLKHGGPERAQFLLQQLITQVSTLGANFKPGTGGSITTAYVNTLLAENDPPYPGNRELERKIKSAVRWNAMAMVKKANKTTNVGGHIATFASAATLYEVGWNHFFKGRNDNHPGDIVFYQGHASPGPYARAYLEGRLTDQHLNNFRRELQSSPGLSSYPHPWLMPDFWQFPTVSMGLGPIMSIYHARYNRYLRDRGLAQTDDTRVWAFLGDGECDEPESLGCITLAAREKLDNLTWVINCNLQRLDGPVRGNGKIVQELEGLFRGAGWQVIKVLWSSAWDPLLKADTQGLLQKRMMEVVDGQQQEFIYRGPAFFREHFFNTPELKAMVAHLTDDQLLNLKRGGHDPIKVYAAYKAAVETKDVPTVILVQTVKGYGIPGAEAHNTAHQAKGLYDNSVKGTKDEKEDAALAQFAKKFDLSLSPQDVDSLTFIKLPAGSPEEKYLHERRKALGGYNPSRNTKFTACKPPLRENFAYSYEATLEGKTQSTTLAWVKLMNEICRDPNIGNLLVPIVPDEGQTFGMPPMYKNFGMYSSKGQLYSPVDKGTPAEYKESVKGQILQEGINEAGAMASYIAAGTAYSTYGVNTIPFYIYYAMFGFQRVGDLVWAAADSRCRGFLMGATAGRTTINGEGLQHEDGHSPLMALAVPTCRFYDPAYGYELAVIIEEGINAMYVRNEECFYYISVYNEAYDMPAMPGEQVREGILKGMYPVSTVKPDGAKLEVQLLGSGVILREALRAQQILADKYKIASTVYSVTSYQMLRKDALEAQRFNRLHPTADAKLSYVEKVLGNTKGPIVATSDYVRMLPEGIAPFLDNRLLALGTDGFGRSETRPTLRRFFEVDAEHTAVAALYALAESNQLDRKVVAQAIQDLKLNPDAPAPWNV
ncbi:MAG: pyruvate dehydrogenase (acetyl-transferring), homodimeric type [Fimbriiglobus sp.]